MNKQEDVMASTDDILDELKQIKEYLMEISQVLDNLVDVLAEKEYAGRSQGSE